MQMEIPVQYVKPTTTKKVILTEEQVLVPQQHQLPTFTTSTINNLYNTQQTTLMVEEEQQECQRRRQLYPQARVISLDNEDKTTELLMDQVKDICLAQQANTLFINKKWTVRCNAEKELKIVNLMDNEFHKIVRVEVDPILRVIVFHHLRQQPTITTEQQMMEQQLTTIKRVIYVPEWFNIEQVKAVFVKECNDIIITAPLLAKFARRDMLKLEQLMEIERLTERVHRLVDVMECEPFMYKVLRHFQRQCYPLIASNLLVPRWYRRNTQEQIYTILFDLKCNNFRANEIRVLLKELEHTLVIKAERQLEQFEDEWKMANECQQFTFQPRTFFNEIQMPKCFDIKRMNIVKLNENTLRLEVPLVKAMMPHMEQLVEKFYQPIQC